MCLLFKEKQHSKLFVCDNYDLILRLLLFFADFPAGQINFPLSFDKGINHAKESNQKFFEVLELFWFETSEISFSRSGK